MARGGSPGSALTIGGLGSLSWDSPEPRAPFASPSAPAAGPPPPPGFHGAAPRARAPKGAKPKRAGTLGMPLPPV